MKLLIKFHSENMFAYQANHVDIEEEKILKEEKKFIYFSPINTTQKKTQETLSASLRK